MIKIENLTKMYSKDIIPLKNINLHIENKQFVAIVGSSGSGKTTLMNILGTLDTQSSGDYFLDSLCINSVDRRKLPEIRNKKIGFIFQSFNLMPKLTAIENVELPLIFAGIDPKKRRILSEIALEKVGLSDRMTHTPSKMSGGQQQRVAIARAISLSPPLILADEPTGNLDPKSTEEVLEILSNLNYDGKTIVLITHDLKVAKTSRRIITLENGNILADITNKTT